MKTEIRKTWQGYEIRVDRKRHPVYVVSVYNNTANCSFDYAHSKHYKSRKRAEEIARKIEAGEIKIK